MRFLYNNIFDDYTITASSAETNYPATFAQDYQLSKAWRTNTVTTSVLSIDVGSGLTSTPTAGAILGHNFTTSVLAYIEGSDDNFSSISSITTIENTVGVVSTDPLIAYDVSGTHRYWRGRFVDAANTDGYHEIGRMYLGTYLDWTRGMSTAFPYTLKDTSTIQFTRTGQSYGNTGQVYHTYNISMPFMVDADRVNIASMYNSVQRVKPIIFVPEEDDPDQLPIVYGVLDDCVFNHLFNYNWSASMTFREVK